MVVMFAVGMGNPAWMVLLGAVSGAQKRASWGPALARPVGLSLLACGAVVAAVHLVGRP
jgi:predicted metal-binding membrane protein